MLSFVFSVIGSAAALILFIVQLILVRNQKVLGTLRNRYLKTWNVVPSLIAFFCFLIISISLYPDNGIYSHISADKHELTKQVDSLSALVGSANAQHESEKIGLLRKEEELTKALKSKITSSYTVTTPVYRIDTVVVVVRDTAGEKRLKEKLDRVQLKNFELTKSVDSLRALNSVHEKEEK